MVSGVLAFALAVGGAIASSPSDLERIAGTAVVETPADTSEVPGDDEGAYDLIWQTG